MSQKPAKKSQGDFGGRLLTGLLGCPYNSLTVSAGSIHLGVSAGIQDWHQDRGRRRGALCARSAVAHALLHSECSNDEDAT